MSHPLLKEYTRTDAVVRETPDIKLLLLGVLRYFGRGWKFDNISEANGISIDTNREFMYIFIEYGRTVLYKKHVIDENVNINIRESEYLFRQAGFNGCIGSTDATYVGMFSCSF